MTGIYDLYEDGEWYRTVAADSIEDALDIARDTFDPTPYYELSRDGNLLRTSYVEIMAREAPPDRCEECGSTEVAHYRDRVWCEADDCEWERELDSVSELIAVHPEMPCDQRPALVGLVDAYDGPIDEDDDHAWARLDKLVVSSRGASWSEYCLRCGRWRSISTADESSDEPRTTIVMTIEPEAKDVERLVELAEQLGVRKEV